MKTVYGLIATGYTQMGREWDRRFSRNVFLYSRQAELYKEEFKRRCCEDDLLDHVLDPDTIDIKVICLDLDESS